jgi:hypothetical protein
MFLYITPPKRNTTCTRGKTSGVSIFSHIKKVICTYQLAPVWRPLRPILRSHTAQRAISGPIPASSLAATRTNVVVKPVSPSLPVSNNRCIAA